MNPSQGTFSDKFAHENCVILRETESHNRDPSSFPSALETHGSALPRPHRGRRGNASRARVRAALIAGDEKKAKEWAEGWQYAGYKMTIFSASEEKWVENDILHAKMYFNMPYALTTAGGKVINGSVDFEPHVIADRELITGQNPRSDHPIAAKLIESLARCKAKAA